MKSPTSTDIISILPQLDKNELKKIQQTADFLINNNKEPLSNSVRDKNDWIYEAMLSSLEANGIKRTLPFEQFKQSILYKKWKSGVEEINNFIEKYFPKNLKMIEKTAIIRMLISSLIRDMRRRNIPITLGTVSKNICHLPEVFDNAFPGYINSGLVHLIPIQLRNTQGAFTKNGGLRE